MHLYFRHIHILTIKLEYIKSNWKYTFFTNCYTHPYILDTSTLGHHFISRSPPNPKSSPPLSFSRPGPRLTSTPAPQTRTSPHVLLPPTGPGKEFTHTCKGLVIVFIDGYVLLLSCDKPALENHGEAHSALEGLAWWQVILSSPHSTGLPLLVKWQVMSKGFNQTYPLQVLHSRCSSKFLHEVRLNDFLCLHFYKVCKCQNHVNRKDIALGGAHVC
jgi:hypothetical protein